MSTLVVDSTEDLITITNPMPESEQEPQPSTGQALIPAGSSLSGTVLALLCAGHLIEGGPLGAWSETMTWVGLVVGMLMFLIPAIGSFTSPNQGDRALENLLYRMENTRTAFSMSDLTADGPLGCYYNRKGQLRRDLQAALDHSEAAVEVTSVLNALAHLRTNPGTPETDQRLERELFQRLAAATEPFRAARLAEADFINHQLANSTTPSTELTA